MVACVPKHTRLSCKDKETTKATSTTYGNDRSCKDKLGLSKML